MKIKVLALSYLFPNLENPDYGIFVYNRLKAVTKSCDVKVIAPLQWFPFLSKFRRSAGGSKIRCYEKIGELDVFHPRFLSIPRFFKWFDSITYFLSVIPAVCHLKYKEKYDFDIVDVHWTYPDILAGYLISKIYRKKLIVTIRGKEALYLGEIGGRKMILNWLLKKADIVVNLSSELKELVQQIGVKPDRARVIYNGVDIGQFSYVDKHIAREHLNLPENKKILLSVGSLIRRKGHHELIKLMPELSRNIDIDLYIVGGVNPEGDYSSELKALIVDLGLPNIHLIDTVSHDQLKNWYAAADLFCLATTGEGCPNVVLEAMACGCPVVASNVGAVSDLVIEGESGSVVDLQCWDWPQRVVDALSQKWNRQQIAQQMNKMDWDTCADEVVDTYRSLFKCHQKNEGPMKIIYHHRTLGDGAEGIHIREMVKAFRDLGHLVRVVGPIGETVPEPVGKGGILSRIKAMLPGILFELCEIGYTFYSFVQMSWLIRTVRPDFIYDRYITFNAGCVLAAKVQMIPIFLEVNAPLALERSEQPDEKLFFGKISFFIEKWVCSNSFKTIVVSTPLKNYLVSLNVSENNIVVMPNGVDPNKFIPQPKDKELLKKIGIRNDTIVIGFTGVLRPWHGLDFLIDVFKQLIGNGNKIFLLIVGDGPVRDEVEDRLRIFGLSEYAYITGKIPHVDVPKFVNLFDIAVSPKATFYASPMKVIEYMALGKAVVVPALDNFLDIIDDNQNGTTFAENNLKSLVHTLSEIIDDTELRLNLGVSARGKVEERLNWQWNAQAVCAFIEKN